MWSLLALFSQIVHFLLTSLCFLPLEWLCFSLQRYIRRNTRRRPLIIQLIMHIINFKHNLWLRSKFNHNLIILDNYHFIEPILFHFTLFCEYLSGDLRFKHVLQHSLLFIYSFLQASTNVDHCKKCILIY